jgi:Ser/Thr protein kinase RdoA (MazF antagonist)
VTINSNTPYATLDPDSILDAIESVGFRSSGSLLALNSYENRVYQIGIEDRDPIIAKFYRPNRWSDDAILEEHQFGLELVEHEIPVIAPLVIKNETLHHFNSFRFALFTRQGGRALELDNLDQLEWMGRFIGRLHARAACRPFQHRHTLNIETFGHKPSRFLLENNFIPQHLQQQYCQITETLLKLIEQMFKEVGDIKQIRLHGDCHPGNVLWRDSGPHIVDLDDSMMGPAIQDIWMLLSGNKMQMNLQIDMILDGYNDFYDFNYRELHLIEALRALRMLHYSAWLAKRWDDPAFPLNFPWFNTVHYWQEQIGYLNEQSNLLSEAR